MKLVREVDEMDIATEYDVLVVGGGIAGMEAALNLADMGFKVLLVEKEPSIGGKMILLSKVFPTLDCASCIATPKMAATAHHPNITVLTYSEVEEVRKVKEGLFKVKVLKKPRYVKEDLCTGCQQCEFKCPVTVPDQFNYGMVARKAIYIPFSTATPRIALIDIDNCILCGICEQVCPADAIDFTEEPVEYEIEVGAVIISTGFRLFPAEKMPNYGFGRFKNVITSMQMDRLLSPTRPYNTILRPSDGRIPDKIAYVLCTGSRDKSVGNPLCSQVCCMYSIKQAQLLMGALPLADIYIFYIDIRAFGKGFEEFYNQAKAMGVNFIKGKIAKIIEKENGNLILRYEDIDDGGKLKEEEFDLVVLSVGLLPNPEIRKIFVHPSLELDEYGYVKVLDEELSPAKTNIDGVYVAGTATGPMDIPDSIISAGSAAAEAASYLSRYREKAVEVRE